MYSSRIFFLTLEDMYTNSLTLDNIDQEAGVELLQLADMCGITRLKEQVSTHIIQQIEVTQNFISQKLRNTYLQQRLAHQHYSVPDLETPYMVLNHVETFKPANHVRLASSTRTEVM